MKRVTRFFLVSVTLCLAALAWSAGAVSAQPVDQADTGDVQMTVRVGFDGYVQTEAWTPVFITASNDGADISGELHIEVDGISGVSTTYSRPIELPGGSRKQVTLYINGVSGFGDQLEVGLYEDNRLILVEQVKIEPVSADTLLIGLWSDAPAGLVDLALVMPSSGETRVAFLTEDDLPETTTGWSALDVLVVADADTGKLTDPQLAALYGWLSGGGRLLIVGGLGAGRTTAGLGDLTPLMPDSTETVSMEPLVTLIGIGMPAQAIMEAPVATGDLTPSAHVLASSDGVPLICMQQVGYGRVSFVAFDPYLEPLNSWKAMPAVWAYILSEGEARPAWAYGFIPYWQYARDAVAAVPGVKLPSVIQLCGFLGLYVVLIGPVNYFVLARMKKRELAWFTIPLLIILFSGIAYITGFQLRGSRVILHRLALIQSWGEDEPARVDALLGVWSPRRARYDIDVQPGMVAYPMSRDIGGALTGTGGATITEGEAFTLSDVRVDVGSVQPYVIEGYTTEVPEISGSITIQPDLDGLRFVGEVVNDTGMTLEDASLVLGQSVVQLGDLAAGEVLPIDQISGLGSASAAPGAALDPYPADYSYYSSYYDEFSTQVINGYCYGSPEYQRRCNLLASVRTGLAHGSGVYLFGWGDSIPLTTDVQDAASEVVDMALYVVELPTTLEEQDRQQMEVPPGLTVWELIDDDGYWYPDMSPYYFSLWQDNAPTFHFEPGPYVPPMGVDSFVVHMEASYFDEEYNRIPRVSLYNVQTGKFDQFQFDFGDNIVGNAADYVDAGGGVTIRIETGIGDTYGLTIDRLDVTFIGTTRSEE